METQKKPPVLVFVTNNYQDTDAALFATREVLFKPLINYRIDALLEAGYEKIYVIDGKYSDNYAPLSASVSQVTLGSSTGKTYPLEQAFQCLKDTDASDILICWADFPVTPASTIADMSSSVHAQIASNEENFFYLSKETLLPVLGTQDEDLTPFEDKFQSGQCACGSGEVAPPIPLPHHFLRLQSFFRAFKNNALMNDGVYLMSTDGILIHPDAKIGKNTLIYPGTIIKQGVSIGENCVIGPDTLIEDCTIGHDTIINASQLYQSTIKNHVKIGPYCHIRPNSVLRDAVQLGDFVEVKNSTIDEETHVSHLTYIGDSDFGKRINVGCGVVVVNYDGQNKYRTTVGDGSFIGCNTNLVSPVHLGEGAYTAAGSTITENIPEDSLGIARAKQVNKEGWAKGKYKKQEK